MNPSNLKKQLAMQMMRERMMQQASHGYAEEQAQFKDFSASELYCPTCKRAMPVREKMLLVLASGDMFDYVCQKCGTSLGTRTTG